MEPISIGEILQAKGDADIAGGAGALLPAGNAANYIANAASARANFNNYVGQLREKRLNDALKSVNDLDYSNVLANDLPDINERYAAAMKDISDNFDVISDPASNIQKYGEYRKKLGQLQSAITTSKAHNTVYGENKKFLAEHPEWNTAENQALMQGFTELPLDQRKQFNLIKPVSFDSKPFATAAMAATKRTVNTEGLSKDKHYLVTTSGEYYDPDEYVQKYTGLLNSTMVNGRTAMEDFREMYNRMPADENGEKPTFNDVLKTSAISSLNKDTKVVSMKPNQVALTADSLAQSERESLRNNALGWARVNQEGRALKAGELKPEDAAEAKNLALYSVQTGNGLDPEFGQNIYGSNASDATQVITFQTGGGYEKGPDGNYAQTPIIKQTIPKVQFVSSVPNAKGGITVTLNENSQDQKTGKITTKKVVKEESFDQMNSSFNRIFGTKLAAQVAAGTSAFNRKKFNKPKPQYEELKDFFERGNKPATPKPSGKENDPLGIL